MKSWTNGHDNDSTKRRAASDPEPVVRIEHTLHYSLSRTQLQNAQQHKLKS